MTRDDPAYAADYADLRRMYAEKDLALTRPWHCTCWHVTVVDCVEIVLLAVEPPCAGCGRPLPWRRTFDA